jgi:hypothetical protein
MEITETIRMNLTSWTLSTTWCLTRWQTEGSPADVENKVNEYAFQLLPGRHQGNKRAKVEDSKLNIMVEN